MARKKKYAQHKAKGCLICGDSTVGRGIHTHVKGAHDIDYETYKKCFASGKIILDKLVQTGTTQGGTKKVVIHILVRRFTV